MHANARRKLRRLREGGTQQHRRSGNFTFDDEDDKMMDGDEHEAVDLNSNEADDAQLEQQQLLREEEDGEIAEDEEKVADGDDDVLNVFKARTPMALTSSPSVAPVRGENNAKNRKRNARRKRAKKRLAASSEQSKSIRSDDSNVASGAPSDKYYLQRYSLFSRFDLGVMLDEEAWYSVTPERLAQHHAQRLIDSGCFGVVDACCGVGGNAIQFALVLENALRRSVAALFERAQFNVDESGDIQNVLCGKDLRAYLTSGVRVIAVDVNEERLRMARNNAELYDVADDSILWWKRNFLTLSGDETSQLQRVANAVFVSPPWGGPGYARKKNFFLSDMPIDGAEFWRAARRVTPNVAMFLPRNIDVSCLQQLAPNESFELEVNYLNDRCKAVTAYWGKWMKKI